MSVGAYSRIPQGLKPWLQRQPCWSPLKGRPHKAARMGARLHPRHPTPAHQPGLQPLAAALGGFLRSSRFLRPSFLVAVVEKAEAVEGEEFVHQLDVARSFREKRRLAAGGDDARALAHLGL